MFRYYTSQSEFGLAGTILTDTNYAHRRDIVDEYLNSATLNSIAVQLRTPVFKQKLAQSTMPLEQGIAYQSTRIARLGHHNDCFLASPTDFGTYSNVITEYPYLEQDTKFVPMGGETCAVYASRTNCATAQDELAKFHWSYLNAFYHPDVINGWKTGNCYTTIANKLGYRLVLTSVVLPDRLTLSDRLSVTINLKNVGYAAPFKRRVAYIVLRNQATSRIYTMLLSTDPRNWLGTQSIVESVPLTSGIVAGRYNAYLHLPDVAASIASRAEYAIRFANVGIWDQTTGYNNLNHVLDIQ